MFARLGTIVARYWQAVILVWIVLLVGLRLLAPNWDDITYDGDLAYLPAAMPSVVGQRLTAAAFPEDRAKSQIVLVVAREDDRLSSDDIYVGYDLARRFKNIHGGVAFNRARESAAQAGELRQQGREDAAAKADQQSAQALDTALTALDEAIRLDEELADYWDDRIETDADPAQTDPAQIRPQRLASAYYNRSLLNEYRQMPEAAAADRQRALALDPALSAQGDRLALAGDGDLPLLDMWIWHDEFFGEKLISPSKKARLIVLQFSNEFMAVDNIRVLQQVEAVVAEVRRNLDRTTKPGLLIGISGSAAIGGDMLRSASDSIKNTELFTVLLVVLILGVIYRSPLLVLVPLISITVAMLVSTSTVALLTTLNQLPGFSWWELKIFTTTKIFIVVILFGAGTDYCLFLISRYKEELGRGLNPDAAMSAALSGVGDALAASALTTILGLGMMIFADFGKFRYSGPVIGFCLAITLATCVTLTPALLRACGSFVFWPFGVTPQTARRKAPGQRSGDDCDTDSRVQWLWEGVAQFIVAYPGRILIASVVLMLPLAAYGVQNSGRVTYDFLSALAPTRPSRQGTELLRQHFPIGDTGPLTVLAMNPAGSFDTSDGSREIRKLGEQLYVPGVRAVRSIEDPLGEYLPGEKTGFISRRAVRLRLLRAHPRTKAVFVTQVPELAGNVTRFEVILDHDPFSIEAVHVLSRIDEQLRTASNDANSYWHNTTFAYAGTTAGIRDLRAVTHSDNQRIKMLVVLAVLATLLVILRRPLVSFYMILSVLLSYYVTLGATLWFFQWRYGDSFHGLDWKVPLFLFVILVAIGQDYNVYLATRVFEEQQRYGPFRGLRRAVVRTGGIITSCGLIMAGTFISMTSGTWGQYIPEWIPFSQALFSTSGGTLRGIVELGFSLALGVMLDTFVVRPVLVPAFLALVCRWRAANRKPAVRPIKAEAAAQKSPA